MTQWAKLDLNLMLKKAIKHKRRDKFLEKLMFTEFRPNMEHNVTQSGNAFIYDYMNRVIGPVNLMAWVNEITTTYGIMIPTEYALVEFLHRSMVDEWAARPNLRGYQIEYEDRHVLYAGKFDCLVSHYSTHSRNENIHGQEDLLLFPENWFERKITLTTYLVQTYNMGMNLADVVPLEETSACYGVVRIARLVEKSPLYYGEWRYKVDASECDNIVCRSPHRTYGSGFINIIYTNDENFAVECKMVGMPVTDILEPRVKKRKKKI